MPLHSFKRIFTLFRISALLCFLNISPVRYAFAQDKTHYVYGKITANDFKPDKNKIDSGANAIIIAEIGNTSFEGDNQGFFTLVFKRSLRVKIVNPNGIGIGNYRLFMRHNKEKSEKLYAIKAATYNSENGRIVETPLDPQFIYTEVYNRDWDIKKFSIPGLKGGSIYDLEYIVKSPFNI